MTTITKKEKAFLEQHINRDVTVVSSAYVILTKNNTLIDGGEHTIDSTEDSESWFSCGICLKKSESEGRICEHTETEQDLKEILKHIRKHLREK